MFDLIITIFSGGIVLLFFGALFFLVFYSMHNQNSNSGASDLQQGELPGDDGPDPGDSGGGDFGGGFD